MMPSDRPPDTDPHEPSCARLTNYWLGGTDNTPADEVKAAEIEKIEPGVRAMVRNNRLFVARATGWAMQEVDQVIDFGCGLPADGVAHELARSIRPPATTALVDYDPEVTDTLDARLGDEPGVAVVRADLRDPAAVFGDPGLCKVIDLDLPVFLLFAFVLHFSSPAGARDLVAEYVRRIAPGSYIAISLPRNDDRALSERIMQAYTSADLFNYSCAEFAALFGGLELVPPGIAPVVHLRPGWQQVPAAPPGPVYVIGAIGRKS
jgi:hypothetical protein